MNVKDQQKSTEFYSKVFNQLPVLNVPGMTEFQINEFCKLGIMPNSGISKIICPIVPHPQLGNGIPRCELYLTVDDVDFDANRLLDFGAKLISPPYPRDWGDYVCYLADLDGHVLALSKKIV